MKIKYLDYLLLEQTKVETEETEVSTDNVVSNKDNTKFNTEYETIFNSLKVFWKTLKSKQPKQQKEATAPIEGQSYNYKIQTGDNKGSIGTVVIINPDIGNNEAQVLGNNAKFPVKWSSLIPIKQKKIDETPQNVDNKQQDKTTPQDKKIPQNNQVGTKKIYKAPVAIKKVTNHK